LHPRSPEFKSQYPKVKKEKEGRKGQREGRKKMMEGSDVFCATQHLGKSLNCLLKGLPGSENAHMA
jgi:hypothetical protein